jgi:hypothetical protein
MKTTKPKKTNRIKPPTFHGLETEAIEITRPEGGPNLHIQALKKDGQNYVRVLKTTYTISESTTPARLGKLLQKVMADVKEKREWESK